ncbi:SGNH/GDSL hydrolase family protein [Rhodococcus spelaei]|uniref:SGNH/GDSL hydrolase family protein n=1 Tax=Rhodococcus spelaei TaxID=2546320 RepID=A0A541B151_9NOCA|nr:SGNH/GDSL hydrolase family protein [Rhodococcus spelaei]TQF66046.1 SGNH/GDSL hydrolase family protein [Rhodococcus spelaei]
MNSPEPVFHRYVALGDSFTEGLGDPAPSRPNGLRGWADRVAEQLATRTDEFGYANLAVRGKLLDQVLDDQLDAAVALEPDLVTVYAGGNDMMRPSVDIDGLVERYDAAIGKLTATGARVAVWTAYDAGWNAIFKAMRGRTAVYNELVREVVERHGATLVDFWRFDGYDDERMWDWDRLHMATPGHERMAVEVLDALGVPHELDAPDLGPVPVQTTAERRRVNYTWTKDFLGPWIGRRLTGRSSGDTVTARRPELGPISVQD